MSLPDLVVVYIDEATPLDEDGVPVRSLLGSTPGAVKEQLKLRCLRRNEDGTFAGMIVFCDEQADLRFAMPSGVSWQFLVGPNPLFRKPTVN